MDNILWKEITSLAQTTQHCKIHAVRKKIAPVHELILCWGDNSFVCRCERLAITGRLTVKMLDLRRNFLAWVGVLAGVGRVSVPLSASARYMSELKAWFEAAAAGAAGSPASCWCAVAINECYKTNHPITDSSYWQLSHCPAAGTVRQRTCHVKRKW